MGDGFLQDFLQLLVLSDETCAEISSMIDCSHMIRIVSSLQEITFKQKRQILLHLFRVQIAPVHDAGLDRPFDALSEDQPNYLDPASFPLACVKTFLDYR